MIAVARGSALLVVLLAVVVATLAVALRPVPAAAAVSARLMELDAKVRLAADGSLHVVETHRYDFGAEPAGAVRRTLQTRARYDEAHDQVFTVTGLKASLDGRPVRAERSDEDGVARVALAFTRAQTGRHTVRLEYAISGAVRRTPEGLELSWPLVQGMEAEVESVHATVSVPRVAWAACLAGGDGSSMPCTAATALPHPEFVQEDLAPGERMRIIVGLPVNAGVHADQVLARRWSLARAFALTPVAVGTALGLLALAAAAVVALWWTRGRDTRSPGGEPYHPLVDVDGRLEFVPPDRVRPGQLGTIVDETADVIDIVATVLDLAVRGVLVIEEVGRTSPHRRPDWRLRRTDAGEQELLPYERVLLDLLFEGRDSVLVSGLAGTFTNGLRRVQEQLYADVHARGWFRQRPDAVRTRWTTAGGVLALAGLVITVVLAAFTDLGLVGLGLVLAGGVLVWGGDVAPARTARGSALLSRLHDFRAYLARADGSELPESSRAELVARFLPYAVVFGLEDRWAEISAASGRPGEPDAGLGWYHAPENWHRVDLADSVDAFVTTLSGAISASRRLRI